MNHAAMIDWPLLSKLFGLKKFIIDNWEKFKLFFLKHRLLLISFRNACYQPMCTDQNADSGRAGFGPGSHLAPAVIHALEEFAVYTLDIPVLFGVGTTSPEETCAQVIHCCPDK